jgi:hypothetical protein
MFHDTQPATLRDAGNPDPWAPFRIGHDGEIVALLRQLRDGAVPVTLSAPGGAAYTTQLWSLDPSRQQLSFAADDDQPQLQQLVAGDEAVAVAYLDSIKLQFDLHDLLVVHGARSAALQAALPRVLYRFQRRSAYRVRTLERTSPAARLRHPSIPDMLLTLRVVDVSIGGCALFLPNGHARAGTRRAHRGRAVRPRRRHALRRRVADPAPELVQRLGPRPARRLRVAGPCPGTPNAPCSATSTRPRSGGGRCCSSEGGARSCAVPPTGSPWSSWRSPRPWPLWWRAWPGRPTRPQWPRPGAPTPSRR